jgi:hypothetical protein
MLQQRRRITAAKCSILLTLEPLRHEVVTGASHRWNKAASDWHRVPSEHGKARGWLMHCPLRAAASTSRPEHSQLTDNSKIHHSLNS